MELNLNKVFNDRLVVGPPSLDAADKLNLTAVSSFWDLLLRFVFSFVSPSSYADENRQAIEVFKTYLVDRMGPERLKRVSARYHIDLDRMQRSGNPLTSRHVAKILTGARVVNMEDLEGLIGIAHGGAKQWPSWFSRKFPDLRSDLRKVSRSEQLSSASLSKAIKALSLPQILDHTLPEIDQISGGAPTEFLANYFFDPFLADRERLALMEENYNDDVETFLHNMVTRVLHRELEVGMLIPAPSKSSHSIQFYRVAARLITGEGLVSYTLVPATQDTDLEPVRLYRGTTPRSSGLDAASTIVTDLERDLGKMAWESGKDFQPLLQKLLPSIRTVAGHSLGSTLAQYDTVDNRDIRKGYFFNGPGLPEEEVEQFNKRVKPWTIPSLDLIIRDAQGDHVCATGKVHLGWSAPSKVNIDYRKYRPLSKKIGAGKIHVLVWGKEERMLGFEGISRENIDQILDHREDGWCIENTRASFGPFFSAILRVARNIFRFAFGSRTTDQLGLTIGTYERTGWSKRWVVKQIRPWEIEAALAKSVK